MSTTHLEQAEYYIQSAWQNVFVKDKILCRIAKPNDWNDRLSKWKQSKEENTNFNSEHFINKTKPQLSNKAYTLRKLLLPWNNKFNSIILNLYPRDEGYSIVLKGQNGSDSETVRFPYEDSLFLEYVDGGQIPPVLVDLLERTYKQIFYQGNVIVEVKDYRQTPHEEDHHSYQIILSPTTQTYAGDVNCISSEHQEEKLGFEKLLLLQTQEPLCLNPSVTVQCIRNKFNHDKKLVKNSFFNSFRNSTLLPFVNDHKTNNYYMMPKPIILSDFLKGKRKRKSMNEISSAEHQVDYWKPKKVNLAFPPSHLDVEMLSSICKITPITKDCFLKTTDEIILEREGENNKIYRAKIRIKQCQSDLTLHGELLIDPDYQERDPPGEERTVSRFRFGSKGDVDRYLQQFQDLFTEEGRRLVKIYHYSSSNPAPKSFHNTAFSTTATSSPQNSYKYGLENHNQFESSAKSQNQLINLGGTQTYDYNPSTNMLVPISSLQTQPFTGLTISNSMSIGTISGPSTFLETTNPIIMTSSKVGEHTNNFTTIANVGLNSGVITTLPQNDHASQEISAILFKNTTLLQDMEDNEKL